MITLGIQSSVLLKYWFSDSTIFQNERNVLALMAREEPHEVFMPITIALHSPRVLSPCIKNSHRSDWKHLTNDTQPSQMWLWFACTFSNWHVVNQMCFISLMSFQKKYCESGRAPVLMFFPHMWHKLCSLLEERLKYTGTW